MYIVTILKIEDYYSFSKEVERIITNLEITNQFYLANQKQSKCKNKDTTIYLLKAFKALNVIVISIVDTNSNTIIAPIRTYSGYNKRYRDC